MQSHAPEISIAYALAQDFTGLVRERASQRLGSWIERAQASNTTELQSFAKGLQQDLAAVTAGISLPWSNGQTEGQVNRLKLISARLSAPCMVGLALLSCVNASWCHLSRRYLFA